jgi:hypothetical protein
MFDQVRLAPVHVLNMPHPMEPIACRVVTVVVKPVPPDHLGEMLRSGFKLEYKVAHFENYDKSSNPRRTSPLLCGRTLWWLPLQIEWRPTVCRC